ncbi:DELTA-actitoxin-Afr1a [Selaginella moellendorffii]|nr:DELTA-actitoxin-Afr1a [Selaginella moellendorffii]|eukprot:XP_002963283.2 DELTA-actitoxin-Afr1a [Selaginella moellendorffii]
MAGRCNQGKGEMDVEEASDEMAAEESSVVTHEEEKSIADEEKGARSVTAVVVAGLGLGSSVINSILNGLGSVQRKIVISFANNTGHQLTAIGVYFFSGTADNGLPGAIPDKSTLGFGARKTSGPVARGTVGVITHYLSAENRTAAIMWSVPFDYNLYSNWWNFELRNGRVSPSRSLFNDLYYTDSAIKGDSNFVSRFTNGRKFEGSMGHSGTPVLDITLH